MQYPVCVLVVLTLPVGHAPQKFELLELLYCPGMHSPFLRLLAATASPQSLARRDPLVLVLPFGHALHVVPPVASMYVLDPQLSHLTAPSLAANVPAAQLVHAAAFAYAYLPFVHVLHDFCAGTPVSWYLPAGQDAQELPLLYWPLEQPVTHDVALALDDLPNGHDEQKDVPCWLVYLPAVQSLHAAASVDADGLAPYLPFTHCLQLVDAVWSAYLPCWQLLQKLLPLLRYRP